MFGNATKFTKPNRKKKLPSISVGAVFPPCPRVHKQGDLTIELLKSRQNVDLNIRCGVVSP